MSSDFTEEMLKWFLSNYRARVILLTWARAKQFSEEEKFAKEELLSLWDEQCLNG